MSHLIIDNYYIHYTQNNTKKEKTLLFLHGNSHDLNTFNHQRSSSELAEVFRLVFVDLPGHGESGNLHTYTTKIIANYIAKFIEALELRDVVVVGHSFGGHVALNLLNFTHIKALFLFGTPPLKNPIDLNAFLPNENAKALNLASPSNAEINNLMAEMNYGGDDFKIAQLAFKKTDGDFRRTILNDILINQHKDELNLLKNNSCRVFFLLASKDSLVNNNYIRKELSLLDKNVQVVEQISGHSPHVEIPDEFNKILKKFCMDFF